MTSEPILDISNLLQPISEENPTGEELTAMSPSFDSVKTLFQDSRTSEREMREREITGASDADDLPPIEPPQWNKVKDIAIEILSTESKDLRVASWLIDALMREDGFVGLRDGLALFDQLCRDYWENIHPAPTEEDGHFDTVAQFDGFAGEASYIPLFELPIARGDADGNVYNSITYVDASDLATVSDVTAREERIQNGAVTFEQLEDAVRNTDSQFYHDLISDLDAILSSLWSISEFLDENCRPNDGGEQTSPSVAYFRNLVQDIRENVNSLARFHLEEPEEEVVDAETGELITGGGEGQRMSTGAVVSRDDAFEVLRKVADFFERTEPHSPVSYALRQVVTWGKMSLPELLQELINDQSTLHDIGKRVGIKPQEEEY